MRAKTISIIAALCVLVVAAPTEAAPASRSEGTDASANAFWTTTRQLSRNTYETRFTYVGVYESSEWGSWADLYQDVETCRVSGGREKCSWSFVYGEAYPGDGDFTVDGEDLSSAHLDAVFDLYTESGRGNYSSSTAQVVVDWTGTGEISNSRETYTYRSGCFSYRSSYDSSSRAADASGSINGVDLGVSEDAWIGTSSSTTRERTC